MSNSKLTKVQSAIIWTLQQGGNIGICENGTEVQVNISISRNEWIDYWVRYKTFMSLVDIGLLYQQYEYPFNYVLTETGEKQLTREPDLLKIFKNARHVRK